MKKINELNPKEKIQKEILKILIFLVVIIVIKGIYNQSNHIDQDYILFPAFLVISILTCAVYSFNAFTSGNLVKNWANTRLFTIILDKLKKNNLISEDKATKITTKIFGYFMLLIGLIAAITIFFWFYTGGW